MLTRAWSAELDSAQSTPRQRAPSAATARRRVAVCGQDKADNPRLNASGFRFLARLPGCGRAFGSGLQIEARDRPGLVAEGRALVAHVDLELVGAGCLAGGVPAVGAGRAVGPGHRPIDQEVVLGRSWRGGAR